MGGFWLVWGARGEMMLWKRNLPKQLHPEGSDLEDSISQWGYPGVGSQLAIVLHKEWLLALALRIAIHSANAPLICKPFSNSSNTVFAPFAVSLRAASSPPTARELLWQFFCAGGASSGSVDEWRLSMVAWSLIGDSLGGMSDPEIIADQERMPALLFSWNRDRGAGEWGED